MQDLSIFLKAINQFSNGEASSEFAEDVLNYTKYFVITNCPDAKKPELNLIFEQGIGQEFIDFCLREIPNFTESLQTYIGKYAIN